MSNGPGTLVHWPTKSQMEKRGLTPYVEVHVGSLLQRIHFRLPREVTADHRPDCLTVKKTGTTVQLFVDIDARADGKGRLVLVEQISRAPAPSRTATH